MPLLIRITVNPRVVTSVGGTFVSLSAAALATQIEQVVVLDPAPDELRLGRSPGVDIELPFPSVSGFHARLFRVPGPEPSAGWWIEDLGSRNGTFVDGVRLPSRTPRALIQGGALCLAEVSVSVNDVGNAPAVAVPAPTGTGQLARRLVNDLFHAVGGAAVARLEVMNGAALGRTLTLAFPDRVYKVGRSPSCDLEVPDQELSREHAGFVRRWDGVFVSDLGSKNGVLLDGAQIAKESRVTDGHEVEIGASRLRVDDPEERYLFRMQTGDDAAMAAEVEVATPEKPAELAQGPAAPDVVAAIPSPGVTRPANRGLFLMAAGVVALAGVLALAGWLVFRP